MHYLSQQVTHTLYYCRYEDSQGRIDKKKRDAVLTARYVEEVSYIHTHIPDKYIHTYIHYIM